MNVVLKPAGLAVVLVGLSVLTYFAVSKRNTGGSPNAPTTKTSTNTASAQQQQKDLGLPTSPAADWSKSRRILEPDITGSNWHALTSKGKFSHSVVPSTVPDHPFALKIKVEELGTKVWDLQIAHPLDAAFKKGDHLRLTYWGRSADKCRIAAVVEQATDPYTKVALREAQLTPEWKQYSEEWVQSADTAAGWAHIDFQVAYQTGTIELTGVQIDAQ